MKYPSLVYFLLLVVFPITRQQTEFKKLQTLTGTWKSEKSVPAIYENWQSMSGTEMHGKSYRLRGTDTIVLEEVKLSIEKDAIIFNPLVRNQNDNLPTPFKLIRSGNQQFVFENPAHDFPQRIIYHFINRDSLHAWIEGKKNGKDARVDYYYKRVH